MTTAKTQAETENPRQVPESIHVLLSRVMADVGAVGKEGRNTQQNFNFRGVDAVVNAVAPQLAKHGVIVAPMVLDKAREVGTTRNGGQMETVYLTVQYNLFGPAGDILTAVVAAQANDTADKATAKAMSVAYRTFWLQTLCIPTDDVDPDHSYEERGQANQVSRPTAEQVLAMIEAATTVDQVRAVWSEHNLNGAPQHVQDAAHARAAALTEEGDRD